MDARPESVTNDGVERLGVISSAAPATWWGLIVLLIFCTLSYCDRNLLPLVVAPVRSDLHLSEVQFGLLQGTAFSLFYASCGIPLGWAIDRWSKQKIIFGAVIVWSLGSALSGRAQSFFGLFAARASVGAGESGLAPAAMSLIPSLFPARRLALAMSIYAIGANIGSGMAMVLGGFLVAKLTRMGGADLPILGHVQPWQMAFLVAGLAGLPLSFLVFTFKEPRRSHAVSQGDASWRHVFVFLRREWRVICCHFTAFPVASMLAYNFIAWGPAYLMRHFHIGVASVGLVLGIVGGICPLLGNLGEGIIADWLFRRGIRAPHYRVHLVATLIGAISGVIAFLTSNFDVSLAFLVIYSLTMTSFGGTSPAALNLISPVEMRGKLIACYWLVLSLVGYLGPVCVALLTQYLFRDANMVGGSLAIMICLVAPITATMLQLGIRPFDRAYQTNVARNIL